MKLPSRLVLVVSAPFILLFIFWATPLSTLWNQYSTSSYLEYTLENTFGHKSAENTSATGGQQGDKVIIMAKLEKEDTSWVADHLPE